MPSSATAQRAGEGWPNKPPFAGIVTAIYFEQQSQKLADLEVYELGGNVDADRYIGALFLAIGDIRAGADS